MTLVASFIVIVQLTSTVLVLQDYTALQTGIHKLNIHNRIRKTIVNSSLQIKPTLDIIPFTSRSRDEYKVSILQA